MRRRVPVSALGLRGTSGLASGAGATMTQEQMNQAWRWFQKHQNHVYKLVKGAQGCYPPTGVDCAHPELWKPEHWQWFISDLIE